MRRPLLENDGIVVHLLSFDYPPNHGGISRLCGEIARALRDRGARGGVVTQAAREPTPAAYPIGARVPASRPQRELSTLRHLRGSTGGVLAGIWYPEGLLALLARRRPLVVLAHGLELRPTRAHWRRSLWRMLCRRVLTAADLVITNSHYTGELAREVAPTARIATVPLAVDEKRFTPGDRMAARERFGVAGRRVISTVARVRAYKGHDTVLHAIAALTPEERQEIVYLVAGRGPDLPALQELAKRLGVAEQVRWLGFVAEEDLPEVYRASDLFVLCTRDQPDGPDVEGFGLVFLEAQACGTPVIGARTGGIPDAIEYGRGGWLIEQDDVPALAAHLSRLVAEPDIYAEAGRAARARVESGHTWAHYTDRFFEVLKDAGIEI